jgi:branched-chain amino acid aminotransferase
LLKDWGVPVREERFTMEEVANAYSSGKLSEVFASGTAAVISPVGELRWVGKDMIVNSGEIGPLSQKLYDTLTGIQSGELPDTHQWTVKL